MTLVDLLILYIAFRLKQLLGDYMFQTYWMAMSKGKKLIGDGGKALFAHSLIHASFSFAIVFCWAPSLWWIGPLDFIVHGSVDRLKAYIVDKKGWTPKDTYFWWALGLDQEAHNYTHLLYIVLIARALGLTI